MTDCPMAEPTPGLSAVAAAGRKIIDRAVEWAMPAPEAMAAAINGAFTGAYAVRESDPRSRERAVVLADKDGRIRYRSSRCRITANDDGTVTLRDLSDDGGWLP